MGEDPSMREDCRAERWHSEFLGLQGSQLCPVFGFDQNPYYWLALQVLASFLIFKLCLMVSCTERPQEPPPQEQPQDPTPPPPQEEAPATHAALIPADPAVEELHTFHAIMDEQLGQASKLKMHLNGGYMSMRNCDPMSTNNSNVTLSSTTIQERDKEVSQLHVEMSNRLRGMEEKWRKDAEDEFNAMLETVEEADAASPPPPPPAPRPPEISVTPLVYWVWQAIMAVVLLFAMFSSMVPQETTWSRYMQSRGVWSHYNLFVYAYTNSGMLPTAAQALVYIAVSASNPLLYLQSSAQLDSSLPHEDARLLEAAPGEEAARGPQDDVILMNKRTVILLFPLLLPLGLVAVTHVLPFMLCYLWVLLIALLLTFGGIWVVRQLAALCQTTPKQEAEAVLCVIQLAFTIFVHLCVPVMTRVYAGEWMHGGYFNQLFSHIFSTEVEPKQCSWLSFSRGVDAVLRWT